MKQFAILSDSSCDLSKENREKHNIDYIDMRILYEDKDIPADLDWKTLSIQEFYDMMRKGVRFRTAQVNAAEFEKVFEKYVEEGKDVLYLACSTGLSASWKQSLIAKETVLAKHPEAKIICIDTRNACHGLGLICLTAAALRDEGKTIEEVAAYVEEHKQEAHQFGAVDNLVYLKRAGRVSTMSAVFGGLLQVKPIIISDVAGQNLAIEKVKGRKNSIIRVADLLAEAYTDHEYQHVFVVHADCEDEAKILRDLIATRLPDKNVPIDIEPLGPIIGASAGPGMIAAYCWGKPVTIDGTKK